MVILLKVKFNQLIYLSQPNLDGVFHKVFFIRKRHIEEFHYLYRAI